jgi:hypothetical protein
MWMTLLLTTAMLVLPVRDMQGKRVDECGVNVGAGGTLTLVCSGNEPMVLAYRVGEREKYPRVRVERGVDGKVVKVEVQPRNEVDWKPVAWAVMTVGVVMWAGGKLVDSEGSVSPCGPTNGR